MVGVSPLQPRLGPAGSSLAPPQQSPLPEDARPRLGAQLLGIASGGGSAEVRASEAGRPAVVGGAVR